MIQRPKWLGGFFGGNLGFLNYEIFTIQHFTRADLKPEAELMAVKWFDYRRLHPLQATYYFVKCYTAAYQDFTRRAVSVDRAPYVRCFSDVDFLTAKEKATVFRLRQLVDRLGMRYDFFLSFAMSWYYRLVGDKGQIYAPRPGHMLKNEELIADAMIAWEELCQVSLQVAKDPYFRVANFIPGNRDQLAHEAFVIDQIKQRQHQRFSLASALYTYDAIRIEEALRQFDGQMVSEALKLVSVS